MSTRPYLGKNVSPESAEEVRQRGILEEGEMLLALFDGVLLDENRRRIGGVALSDFVVLSDRRLITWARGLFNDTVDSFPWQDVDVAKAETWDPWHGRIMLACRLPAVAPRSRRIVVKGMTNGQPENERVIVNTFDYMPADDVMPLSNMIAWVGDQVVSGVTGEALMRGFADQFPASERQFSFLALAAPEPVAPPPPPRSVEKPRKKNWWQRAFGESEEPLISNTGNLINDYESRRASQPAGAGVPALPDPMPSEMPALLGQPSVYEMSRSIQLFLEAPRRLARSVRRAGEMMSGAGDLVNGLQDPQVRRTAMMGIYQAAVQQEMANGPLAPVGPVVRAAVRFSQPPPSEEAQAQAQAPASRRLQVKTSASVRRSAPSLAEEEAPAAEAQPVAPTTTPVRRSINVRRVEQPVAEEAIPEPPPPVIRSVPAATRVPVRRMTVNRPNETVAPQQPPVPVGIGDDE
ncbi:MAG: hypothetical protein HGB28_01395 [Oscillochloris sp.]|nr:hypothetical protein [Oscillochloris sp.]